MKPLLLISPLLIQPSHAFQPLATSRGVSRRSVAQSVPMSRPMIRRRPRPWGLMSTAAPGDDDKGKKGEGADGLDIEELALMYKKARKLELVQRDVPASRAALERISEITPADGRLWKTLARLSREGGKRKEAEQLLKKGLEHDPKNSYLWHSLAMLKKQEGNFVDARLLFRKAVSVDPFCPFPWDAWARMECQQSRFEVASTIFWKGLRYHRTHKGLWCGYGSVMGIMGENSKARMAFDLGLRLHPTCHHLLLAKAIFEYRLGNVEEARTLMQECIHLTPNFDEGWLALALLEESEGNEGGARRYYKCSQDVRIRPKKAFKSLKLWLAWAYFERLSGKLSAAAKLYAQATLALENEAVLWVEWARVEVKLGSPLKAREIFKKAININPRDPTPYRYYAEMEMDLGQYDKARTIYFKGAYNTDDDIEGLKYLLHSWAHCEWRMHGAERGRKIFEWAVRLGPGDEGFIWYEWATMEVMEGNVDLGQHYLSLAVNAEPMYWQAWLYWGELLQQQGDEDKGRGYILHAKEIRQIQMEKGYAPNPRKWPIKHQVKGRAYNTGHSARFSDLGFGLMFAEDESQADDQASAAAQVSEG
ncbi:unnamed protein product [Chrysoparadoxa australica]